SPESAFSASGRLSVTQPATPFLSTKTTLIVAPLLAARALWRAPCRRAHADPPLLVAARAARAAHRSPLSLLSFAVLGALRGADVGLEVRRGERVADEGGDRLRGGAQLVHVDAGLDAHAVERGDDVLGGEVPRGAGRVGAAAEAADRGVDGGDAEREPDE